MWVQFKIILITLSVVVNLTPVTSESSLNSTTDRIEKTTEAHRGFFRGKFEKWRAQCRKKVEFLRVLYNLYTLKAASPIDQADLVLLNHTMRHLKDVKTYRKVKKDPLGHETFLGRMYDFCSRPMGNISNFLAEIKKQTTFIPYSQVPNSATPTRQSRLKEVLDKCTQPDYDAPAGSLHTTPSSNVNKKMNQADFMNRMKFAGPNAEGKLEVFEFYTDLVPTANLSTLINWLHQVESLTSMLQAYKKQDVEFLRQIFGIQENSGIDIKEMLESMLNFIRRFEILVEQELRKPEKDWNYSAEEG